MHIGLRRIRYFIAVAEELHFRRAAERLSIAQPSLTRAVRLLEEEVGATLFDRTTRKVRLTHAGIVLLEGCRDVQKRLEVAVERTRKSVAGNIGHLVVGYTDFAINDELPRIVNSFRKKHTDISMEPRHGFTADQLADINNGQLDFGFVTGPVHKPDIGCLDIKSHPFVAVLPETHRLAAREPVSLLELADEPFILGSEAGWKHYHHHLYRLCREYGFEPKVVQRAFNTEGIFGLVACGMGITLQPDCLANYIRKGLAVRRLREDGGVVPTVAVWDNNTVNPLKRTFIEFLRDYVARLQG